MASTEIACASSPFCLLWWDIWVMPGTMVSSFWFEHLWAALRRITMLRKKRERFWPSIAARLPWQTAFPLKLHSDFRTLLALHRNKTPSLKSNSSLCSELAEGWDFKPNLPDPSALQWTVKSKVFCFYCLCKESFTFQDFVHIQVEQISLWLRRDSFHTAITLFFFFLIPFSPFHWHWHSFGRHLIA